MKKLKYPTVFSTADCIKVFIRFFLRKKLCQLQFLPTFWILGDKSCHQLHAAGHCAAFKNNKNSTSF